MTANINQVAEAIKRMDEQLRTDLLSRSGKALWCNTAIDRRKRGDTFSLSEHIRGMVLSMLSAGRGWEGVEKELPQLDKFFFGYDAKQLKAAPAADLAKQVTDIKCGNRSIVAQMEALKGNIEKLESFSAKSGTIDEYYGKYISEDGSHKNLVKSLAEKENKLAELGVPLVCEYLRHVGYDVPKPDRHICRILGSKYLACSENEEVGFYEALGLFAELAKEVGKPAAEVDYILWAYCADGYGAVCTKVNPKCDICAAKEICKMHRK